MKKTYPLRVEGKHADRVLDAIKHDIRKYFKRERNRALPEGADFWDFDCKVGASVETAEAVRVGAVIEAVDAAAKAGVASVYVEILSKHGVRVPAPARPEAEHGPDAAEAADAADEGNSSEAA
jgi:polyphosphate kinase 2 (PPK2 family)